MYVSICCLCSCTSATTTEFQSTLQCTLDQESHSELFTTYAITSISLYIHTGRLRQTDKIVLRCVSVNSTNNILTLKKALQQVSQHVKKPAIPG
jgi:hypothetical protein